MDNKLKAQQRADQIQAFNAELNCLKDEDASPVIEQYFFGIIRNEILTPIFTYY